MEYLYENAAGERRTIVASMRNAPPEFVVFLDEAYREAKPGECSYRRVIVNPMTVVKNPDPARRGRGSGNGTLSAQHGGAVGGPLCASRSLPRRDTSKGSVVNRGGHHVVEYKDGSQSTLDGKPIVDSNAARDREKGRVGAVEDHTPIVDD